MKLLSSKEILREFVTSRPGLQGMLKEILENNTKWKIKFT